MMTDKEMQTLQAQTEAIQALTNEELLKKVVQYAIANTKPLTDERAFLVEAAMRLEK